MSPELISLCAQQVSLRVCRIRPGRPAALFVQFGGRAGEGAAASGEPASRQRVRPLHILRRRCPGPKVKTIPSCTSLPTHSCTVTLIFYCFGWFAFNFVVCWILFIFFPCLYPCILGLPIHRTRWVQWELRRCVSVCVFVFTSSPLSHCVLGVCVALPAANNPKRRWGCVRCRGLFRVLEIMLTVWSQTNKLNVNLRTEARQKKNLIHNALWRC